MENKSLLLSKTAWFNALIMIAGAVAQLGVLPGVKTLLEGNAEIVMMVIGGLGVGLRMITKGKVVLS